MRTSLEASVLILAVLGLRWVLGQRLSPAWRIGLWMLVGAKLLLPAFVPAGFGLGAWMKSAGDVAPAAAVRQELLNEREQTQTAVLAVSEVTQADGSVARSSSFSPKIALLLVWLAGAAGIMLAALLRQRRFEKMLRRRRPGTNPHLVALVARLAQRAVLRKPVRIVLMPAGTAPAMVGVQQPTLLLPEDWETRFDETSLRHVVAHELCHVKQGDLAWNWAALAVQAVHWFNPLVWLVVSRFQADRELRCDAGALALLAPAERLDYGHTLLRIQESFFAPPAVAGLAPCVRNHPTLRQRILMIASPTTRQPWLQALLVLTLGVLVCYSFTTTARAQEKEVPPKVRTRDSGNGGGTGAGTTTATPAAQEDGKKPAARERDGKNEGDGGAKKTGMRDGEGERKPGARDGEGGNKKPGTREGDGEKPRSGERDGEKPRTGARDGEGARKPGMRDGEKPRTGERDGKPREGRADSSASESGETITLHVTKAGDMVRVGEEEIAMNRLRGHLSNFLPEHPGAKILVTGDSDVPLGALHNTVDAVRDNGNKNVRIQAE